MGAGPFPGGARRWEVARTERNTTPKWAPDAPKPPSPALPPDTRERHGPPPHSDNPRRHSLPSPWAGIPALDPPWARRPPSQRSLTGRGSPKRTFSWSAQALPTPETAPTQGRNGSRGPRSGESGILEPLGEKTIQRCSASLQVLQGRHSHRRDGGQRHLFQGASETALAWKESPRLTCLRYSQEPWEANRLPREPA